MTEETKSDGRKARRSRSRERIVEAAFLIVQRGNWRPSVVDIAKQAGVSVRTVFDIFGALEGVYAELMVNYSISLRDMLSQISRNDPTHGMNTLHLVLMGRLPVAAEQQGEPV